MDDAVAQAQPLIDHRFDFMAAGLGFADDDVDVVLLEALQAVLQFRRAQVDELAVDARAPEAELARAGEEFLVEAFAAAHERAQHHDILAAVGARDAVDDLAARSASGSAGRS